VFLCVCKFLYVLYATKCLNKNIFKKIKIKRSLHAGHAIGCKGHVTRSVIGSQRGPTLRSGPCDRQLISQKYGMAYCACRLRVGTPDGPCVVARPHFFSTSWSYELINWVLYLVQHRISISAVWYFGQRWSVFLADPVCLRQRCATVTSWFWRYFFFKFLQSQTARQTVWTVPTRRLAYLVV